jgi:transposase
MKAMARHRTHSIDFKRRVVEEYLGGDPQHVLSKRHDLTRGLIRIWVAKYEAGAYDSDADAADLLQEREVKIAALERLAGRQALEIEFLKGALKNARPPRNAATSVIAGPAVSALQKDVG